MLSAQPFSSSSAVGRQVKIIRRLEGREISYVFSYSRFVRGNAPGTNVRVQPGDVVIVPD